MSRTYSSASVYSAKNICFKFYGIFKREKLSNDFSEVWQYEICLQKHKNFGVEDIALILSSRTSDYTIYKESIRKR